MRRVGIADIMRETGLSRATVDRALNGRGRVHARTRAAIEETLRRLGAAEPAAAPGEGAQADIVLRIGRGMMDQMRAAWRRCGARGAFHDMHLGHEADIVGIVRALCEDASRPLILCAKNTGALVEVLREARGRGKPVATLVSDLAPEARDFHVGIDNRSAGRAAAWLIGRTLGESAAPVGVVVGDFAFRCHEDREIGFRTGLRALFPQIAVVSEAQGEDNAELTRAAVARLLKSQPALRAIYNVGGGNMGVAQACQEAGLDRRLLIVGHEVNAVTAPLLGSGAMDFAIASDPTLLLQRALARFAAPAGARGPDTLWLDFAIYTRFNLPGFSIVD